MHQAAVDAPNEFSQDFFNPAISKSKYDKGSSSTEFLNDFRLPMSLNHGKMIALMRLDRREIAMEKTAPNEDVLKTDPLKITRTFNVSSEILFDTFIDEKQIKEWWGPQGFTSPAFQADPKVGGTYLGCMKSPEGQELWSTGTFIEIDKPRKLKYTDCFADSSGNVVAGTHYGMSPNFPRECVVELSFIPVGDQTQLTLKHFGIPHDEIQNCTTGWSQSFDKLEAILDRSVDVWAKKMEAGSVGSDMKSESDNLR